MTDANDRDDRFRDEPPPTDEELREAARLRAELDEEPLARALRSAHAPKAIDPGRHRALVERALGSGRSRASVRRITPRSAPAFAGILALAAAVALFFRLQTQNEPVAAVDGAKAVAPRVFALSRSASALVASDPSNEPSRSSERVDRIAYARARDFRDNRFASWGVR